MKNKIQVYLAGSMFCEADRMYNALLAEKIRERVGNYIDLYVPQENLSINDKTKCANSHDIFWGDYNRLQNCDIFIARIDGDIPPSGTSAEIGIMSQRRQNWEHGFTNFQANYYLEYGKHASEKELLEYKQLEGYEPMILGLCTDSRNPKRTYLEAKNELMKNEDYESQYCYFNLFTLGCIKVNGELATSIDELVNKLEAAIKMRVGERKEIDRTKVGRFWNTRLQAYKDAYYIEYSDGTSELVWGELDE
jgi:nucleoside 2-deoxyribosyltransferase